MLLPAIWHVSLRRSYRSASCLRTPYTMSSTDKAYATIGLGFHYRMSCTDMAYAAIGLGACYAMSGTELGYGGRRISGECWTPSRTLRSAALSPYAPLRAVRYRHSVGCRVHVWCYALVRYRHTKPYGTSPLIWACYAMSGTEFGYGATKCAEMSCRQRLKSRQVQQTPLLAYCMLLFAAIRPHGTDVYGTELAYGATQCAVLSWRMVGSGATYSWSSLRRPAYLPTQFPPTRISYDAIHALPYAPLLA
eukprot:537508-Rhodomonas_salina.2